LLHVIRNSSGSNDVKPSNAWLIENPSISIQSKKDLYNVSGSTDNLLLTSQIRIKMSEAAGCTRLYTLKSDVWLSSLFGCHAWCAGSEAGGQSLALLQDGNRHFAYAKLDAADIAATTALTDIGFRLVDTAISFSGIPEGEAVSGMRFANSGDRDAVAAIAGQSFRFSRFHLDPQVPNALANAIKVAWAANYFAGQRGDGMVIAEHEGRVAGFLQLLWAGDRLVIDLIGVAPQLQGRGFGRGMIRYAARYGTGDGRIPAGMLVGTQAANIPSVRLYESLGFRMASAQHVLHHHGSIAENR
jgi:ribosomal protein S18 acetylase RimI-like enzyme